MLGPAQLGLYSLAFTLAFAPLTQFSWRLGTVLMPTAAATADLELVGRRTVRAMRFTGLLFFPLMLPAVILAPLLVPLLFGGQWSEMVVPLQILLPVGTCWAVIAIAAEALAGSGSVDLHARLLIGWTTVLVPSLVLLVNLDGIRGAAIAHLVVLIPAGGGYLLLGARRLGLGRAGLLRPLVDFVGPVLAQVAAALAVTGLLTVVGAPAGPTRIAAALAAGAAAAAVLLLRGGGPLPDARALVKAILDRS